MATKKKAVKKIRSTKAKKRESSDAPSLFRINVEVGNLEQAAEFYGKLFGLVGRKQAGSRCYFTCGPVTLQVVDVSSVRTPHPAAKALYFTVNDLDAVFARAKALKCVSQEDVHVVSGGAISVRPWRPIVLRRGQMAQPFVLRRGRHDLSRLKLDSASHSALGCGALSLSWHHASQGRYQTN